jgi:hypothetical protein
MYSSGVPTTESSFQNTGVKKNRIRVKTSIIGCRSLNLVVNDPIQSETKKPLTMTITKNPEIVTIEIRLNE